MHSRGWGCQVLSQSQTKCPTIIRADGELSGMKNVSLLCFLSPPSFRMKPRFQRAPLWPLPLLVPQFQDSSWSSLHLHLPAWVPRPQMFSLLIHWPQPASCPWRPCSSPLRPQEPIPSLCSFPDTPRPPNPQPTVGTWHCSHFPGRSRLCREGLRTMHLPTFIFPPAHGAQFTSPSCSALDTPAVSGCWDPRTEGLAQTPVTLHHTRTQPAFW